MLGSVTGTADTALNKADHVLNLPVKHDLEILECTSNYFHFCLVVSYFIS